MINSEEFFRESLATVFNLIKHFGWDDLIFTHASARIPNTNYMLINRFGVEFDRITPLSLLKVDIFSDDSVEHSNIAGINLHRTFYRCKPEVNGVIHTHTNEGIAVSADKRGLVPISQQSMFVIPTLSYFDQYNGVIVDDEDPLLMVDSIKDNKCMILRNHGLLTCGTTIQEAFMYMYHLQKSCEIQTITDLDNAVYIDVNVNQQVSDRYETFRNNFDRTALWEMLGRISKRARKS